MKAFHWFVLWVCACQLVVPVQEKFETAKTRTLMTMAAATLRKLFLSRINRLFITVFLPLNFLKYCMLSAK
jgi:hypothetical protein